MLGSLWAINQGGSVTSVNSSDGVTVTFPIEFLSVVTVELSLGKLSNSPTLYTIQSSTRKEGATIFVSTASGWVGGGTVRWLAVGV